jgi:AraC-like DNA-binding protein
MEPANLRRTNFRFSSEDVPQDSRRAAICGLRHRGILPFEPLANTAKANIIKHFLPGAGILTGTLAGLRQDGIVRTADASDDIFLGINVRGRSLAKQNGREIEFGDGDAIFLSSAEGSFEIMRPAAVEFVGIRVPRAAVAPLIHSFDGRMRCVPRQTAVLSLLTDYATAVPSLLAEPVAKSAIIANHLSDLIAFSVELNQPTESELNRSVRAARLQSIKSDILARLRDSALTIATIARHQRVTSRYIHKLFADEGMTFTHYVLRQRLDNAYRLLRDQRCAHRSITSIAYDVGFNDLSYFNRAFRRQFQVTPSDIRNKAILK